jgi:multiple sugar transport system permease protein
LALASASCENAATDDSSPPSTETGLVTGDVYQWGSPMAGSLPGSMPAAIIYSFFVEYYVSSMTGAV